MAKDRRRRYALQSHEFIDWQTGFTSDGRQVLMGVQYPYITAVFFDRGGAFIECIDREVPFQPAENRGPFSPAFQGPASGAQARWQAEMGYRPGTIHVLRFQ